MIGSHSSGLMVFGPPGQTAINPRAGIAPVTARGDGPHLGPAGRALGPVGEEAHGTPSIEDGEKFTKSPGPAPR